MANDARIAVGLPAHPKTKKLIRRIGEAGAWYLVRLFLWAASDRSNGDLSGLSDEDIELAVDWSGEEGAFVEALANVGFIDGEEGARAIHDWEEHNPWAAGAEARIEKSRWAALCKQYGREGAAKRMPEYAASIGFAPSTQSGEEPDSASGMPEELLESASGTPPAEPNSASGTPVAESSSAPLPSFPFLSDTFPKDIEPNGSVGGADRLPRCDHQAIVDLYHQKLPEMPPIRMMSDPRKKALASFWKFVLTSKKTDGTRRAETANEALAWVGNYFDRARHNDFLMGRGPRGTGHENWKCDLDFLLTEKGRRHVIEKTEVAE